MFDHPLDTVLHIKFKITGQPYRVNKLCKVNNSLPAYIPMIVSIGRPLGRPRRRWEDDVRMDLQEVGCGCEDWIGLALDRDRWRALVSAVRNFGFHKTRGIS
jgi:hypothetical protein